MSDTIVMICIHCGHETDCIDGICLECRLKSVKKWAVPIKEWNKLVKEKRRLQILLENIRKRYSIDVCSIRPQQDIAICSNRPPEITNLKNSCLSCRMRETCRLLYEK